MRKKHFSGFTLIELMVVIAIIGLLSSVILASLSQTKSKASVSKEIQVVEELHKALELYYTKYGQYPSTCSGDGHVNTTCSVATNMKAASMCSGVDTWGPTVTGGTTVTNWVPGLVSANLISALPTDTNAHGASNNLCCYRYQSNGTDYKLQFNYKCQSVNNVYESYPTFIDPNHDGDAIDSCTAVVAGTNNAVSPSWSIHSSGGCSANAYWR